RPGCPAGPEVQLQQSRLYDRSGDCGAGQRHSVRNADAARAVRSARHEECWFRRDPAGPAAGPSRGQSRDVEGREPADVRAGRQRLPELAGLGAVLSRPDGWLSWSWPAAKVSNLPDDGNKAAWGADRPLLGS